MEPATIEQIDERLRELPPEKLAVVLEFVTALSTRPIESEAFQTMLASEAVLARDWDTPEEDAAWAHL
ncbi:MAG: DUF2281 domain-containing protein [Dehalococcoidia bacterium]